MKMSLVQMLILLQTVTQACVHTVSDPGSENEK